MNEPDLEHYRHLVDYFERSGAPLEDDRFYQYTVTFRRDGDAYFIDYEGLYDADDEVRERRRLMKNPKYLKITEDTYSISEDE